MTSPDRHQPECVLRPRGELGLFSVDRVLNRWLQTIDRHHPHTVTVDLSAVTLLDESGLRMLRFFGQRLYTRGIRCRFLGATSHQERLIGGSPGSRSS